MYRFLVIAVSLSGLFDAISGDAFANAPMDARKYFDVDGDLTKVTWVHRVNSRAEIDAALSNHEVMMIETDIIAGHLKDVPGGDPIPVMGHPPDTMSDISLEQFLHKVLEKKSGKGIKLDFKSLTIFKASEDVLEEFLAKAEVDFPVWINADILPGPGVSETHPVVDAKYFLETCVNKFPIAYISPGWAVDVSSAKNLRYEKKHLEAMATVLSEANVVHGVTFPVHAGIASNSLETLPHLVKTSADGTTLTLWAGEGSWVDYDKLRTLIDTVGKDKIYIDIPKDMLNKLHSPPESKAAATTVAGASGMMLVLLGLLTTLLPAFH